MAKKVRKVKKPRIKLNIPKIKAKLCGKAYVGDEFLRRGLEISELKSQKDSLVNRLDSLQHENDSLKKIVRIEIKYDKK